MFFIYATFILPSSCYITIYELSFLIIIFCAVCRHVGIDIRHEGVGKDAGCGWPYVANLQDDPMYANLSKLHRRYVINNAPGKQVHHRYRMVLHQVRHPLSVIRTLVVRAPRQVLLICASSAW